MHARYFAVFCITSGTYTHSMSRPAFFFWLSYATLFPLQLVAFSHGTYITLVPKPRRPPECLFSWPSDNAGVYLAHISFPQLKDHVICMFSSFGEYYWYKLIYSHYTVRALLVNLTVIIQQSNSGTDMSV